jgi:hypothetical protein
MYQGFEYNLKLLIDFYHNKLKFYAILLIIMVILYIVILVDQTYYSDKLVHIFLIVYFMIALKTYINIYYILNLSHILNYYKDDIESVETKLRKKLYKLQNSIFRINGKLYTFYSILYSNIKSKQ